MQHRIRSAGVLIRDGTMLLLRVKDFSGEYWIPPGGGLEEDDKSTKQCLIREFNEEAGLKVDVGELICVREFYETHLDRYNAEFFYLIDDYEGVPQLNNLVGLNDENYIQALDWVPIPLLEDMRIYPKELKGKVLDLIEAGRFSNHLGSYVQGIREDINQL